MAVVALTLFIVVILLCLRRDVSVRLELFEFVRVQIDACAKGSPSRETEPAEADPAPALETS